MNERRQYWAAGPPPPPPAGTISTKNYKDKAEHIENNIIRVILHDITMNVDIVFCIIL